MGYRCFALVVMTTLIQLYANAAEAISEKDRWVVAEKISTISEGLPTMIDKTTRWESVVLNGTTVSYVFTLLQITKEEAPDDAGFLIYRQTLNGYCTAGGFVSHLRDYEVDLSIYFRDVEGNTLASSMINHGDCPEEVKEDTIISEPKLGDTIAVDPEWLSLSERLFTDAIEIWPAADNPSERLLGKWQNDEAPVIYQFLANGDAHRIEDNKVTLLNYSVADINKERRMMLLKINENTDSGYDLYIQFYLVDQEARVAIVKDGDKTFEKWTYAGRPDLIAIAKQYAYGKKPWISRSQLLESDEYKRLDDRERSSTRENWKELFGNN